MSQQMKHSDNNSPADMLERINKVDAPAFLLTRIRQKIANAGEQQIAPKWAFAAGFSLLLVVALNLYIITSPAESRPQENNLAQTMNLIPHNSLYE
jgi:hypothetical protein